MALFDSNKQRENACQRNSYPKVLEYANQHRKEGFFVDVAIQAENVRIPANKVVLSCCSKMFEKMFKASMKERDENTIQISSMDSKSLELLIDYMYSGNIIISNENISSLLAGADYLQMDEVKEFCAEYLEASVSPSSCLKFLDSALLYRLDTLQTRIYQVVGENLEEVSSTEQFLALSKDDLENLITKLKPEQTKVSSLFHAVISWTKHNKSSRKKNLPALMQLLDFDRLSKNFVEKVVAVEPLMRENLDCANMLLSAVLKNANLVEEDCAKVISIGGLFTKEVLIELTMGDCNFQQIYSKLPCTINANQFRSLLLENFIYCFGGTVEPNGDEYSNKTWRLAINEHPVTAVEVASMNERRLLSGAAVFRDMIVVTGGENERGHRIASAEVHIPQINEWKMMSSTNLRKFCNSLVCFNNCLYDIGGTGTRDNLILPDVEKLENLTGRWKYARRLLVQRTGHVAVACIGKIYVIAGRTGNTIESRTSSVEVYDHIADKWSFGKPINIARAGHAACVIRGKIYVVGGFDTAGQIVDEIECYDPDCDTWSIVTKTTPYDFFTQSLIVM